MTKQLIYQIIRKLADRTLPASQRDIVLRWLIGPQDTSEKEKTMFRLWNDTNGTEVSDESATRALQNVKETQYKQITNKTYPMVSSCN